MQLVVVMVMLVQVMMFDGAAVVIVFGSGVGCYGHC